MNDNIDYYHYHRNDILSSLRDDAPENILIVAHNAVNQALIGTALGLQPFHFRRLVQSNAAATVINFLPGNSDGESGYETSSSAPSGFGNDGCRQSTTPTSSTSRQRADWNGPITILDGLNETPEVPLGRSSVRLMCLPHTRINNRNHARLIVCTTNV